MFREKEWVNTYTPDSADPTRIKNKVVIRIMINITALVSHRNRGTTNLRRFWRLGHLPEMGMAITDSEPGISIISV